MQNLPPTLTPMERQLLISLQNLEQVLQERAAAQDAKITALETQISARDQAITTLTASLKRLLGPLDPD
jgi:uncharacterized coiled-coil protein SlyX